MTGRRLEERLARSPAVQAARAVAVEDAWLVGGAVRDAALGREVVDVDIAVSRGEREAARAIADHVDGHTFELSAEFGTWRALGPNDRWHVDVTRLRADAIESDLRLRDFTVNAIGIPLGALDAGPVDPTGGLADAERAVLRAASPRAFEDDPLRVLRAARLAAGLGFEVENSTARMAREAVGRLTETAGERQLAELRLLLASTDPLRGLSVMDGLGATAEVLPEVEALRGVEQNPNHHLDAHGHTIEVLRQLLELEDDLERVAGNRAPEVHELLDEPLADAFRRRDALRLGALLHDVGKPATRDESRGFVTFIGHDHAGAEIVDEVCLRLKASRTLRSFLRGVTLHHLRLGFLAGERPLRRRRIHEYLCATEPVSADVTLLTVADRLSARGEGPIASAEMIQAHVEVAGTMLGAALDRLRDGPPRSPIRGDELAAALGIEPGPRLGRLIAEVEAGVYAGEVHDPQGALELARSVLARTQ